MRTPTTAPHLTHPTAAPSAAGAALQLVDVRKQYGRGGAAVHALRGVSLALDTGSFTAVMGPSGSGKSTLLHVAAGLDVPTHGQVHVGGLDISRLTPDALARFRRDHVGFVFQAYNLVPHLSVADNVTLPVVLAGREPDRDWLSALLRAVGLGDMAGRRPGQLSGGQAQRVAIARALFSRPTIVFADEPTGALDARTGAEVLALLRDTARTLGQTVVMVTHDAHVAAAAEQVLLIQDGQVVDRVTGPTPQVVAERMLALELDGAGR